MTASERPLHFGFQLDPLADVAPWGEDADRNLHWFGLTSGTYWIDVGTQRLFEFAATDGGPPICLDYQVARLYEDIVAITPRVLEPVPDDLAAMAGLARDASALRIDALDHLWAEATGEADDDADAALAWRSERALDVLYLTVGPEIVLWSDETQVHVAWDNRSIRHDGRPVWTADSGVHSVTGGEFVAAVIDFHRRLMDAMAQRVAAVAAGALPQIRIDVPGLEREHRRRARLDESALAPASERTDWERVRTAIRSLTDRAGDEN